MARTLIAPVTVAVLISACAGVACSKSGDSTSTKAPSAPGSSQAGPVPTAAPPASFDGEGFAGTVASAPAGPVSFADGEAAYHDKKYGEAVAVFARYTEQKPGNAWGHFMLGLAAWKSGDSGTAEKAFNDALAIDPGHVKSLVNLSRVLLEERRFDEAAETLARAEDLAPDSTDVQRLLGRAFGAQGKIDDAEAAYREAIALDEKDAWSMNNLGLLLLEARRADDALPLLARAVELRKDVAVFHNNLGMALEHTGRFGAAASEYREALTADAGYRKAEANLARVEAVKHGPEEPFDLAGSATTADETKAFDEPAENR